MENSYVTLLQLCSYFMLLPWLSLAAPISSEWSWRLWWSMYHQNIKWNGMKSTRLWWFMFAKHTTINIPLFACFLHPRWGRILASTVSPKFPPHPDASPKIENRNLQVLHLLRAVILKASSRSGFKVDPMEGFKVDLLETRLYLTYSNNLKLPTTWNIFSCVCVFCFFFLSEKSPKNTSIVFCVYVCFRKFTREQQQFVHVLCPQRRLQNNHHKTASTLPGATE